VPLNFHMKRDTTISVWSAGLIVSLPSAHAGPRKRCFAATRRSSERTRIGRSLRTRHDDLALTAGSRRAIARGSPGGVGNKVRSGRSSLGGPSSERGLRLPANRPSAAADTGCWALKRG